MTFTTSNMQLTLDLPEWAINRLNRLPEYMPDLEARMAAVIRRQLDREGLVNA